MSCQLVFVPVLSFLMISTFINPDHVIALQQVLVQILQSHINDWYHGSDNFLIVPDNYQIPQHDPDHSMPPSSQDPPVVAAIPDSQPVSRNGHVLKIMETGGVFCQKCGKSTKLQKHQRLKILSKPCVNPNLPMDQWLHSPGAMNNKHRLEKAWKDLHQIHNKPGHQFFWNQKCGKKSHKIEEYGLL